jgi:hypothetical protein
LGGLWSAASLALLKRKPPKKVIAPAEPTGKAALAARKQLRTHLIQFLKKQGAHLADHVAQLYGEVAEKLAKYSEDEPRVPAGSPEGGQWTSEGASDSTPEHSGSDQSELHIKPISDIGTFEGDKEDVTVEQNAYTDPDREFMYRGTSAEEVRNTLNGSEPGLEYWGNDFSYSSDFTTGYKGGGSGFVMVADPAGPTIESREDVIAVLQPYTGQILWEKTQGFKHQGFEQFIQGTQKLAKASKDDINEILKKLGMDWGDLVETVQDALEITYLDSARGALDVLDLEPTDELFNTVNAAAETYAKSRAAELVGKRLVDGELVDNPNPEWAITETTRDALRALITDGFEEGWTPAQLSEQIQDSFQFSEARADMIAQTEAQFAHSNANLETWAATGVVTGKQWLLSSVHKEENCDGSCDDNAEAGVVDIDDDFPSGDLCPPAHPNCVCSMIGITGAGEESEEDVEEAAQDWINAADVFGLEKSSYTGDTPRDEHGRWIGGWANMSMSERTATLKGVEEALHARRAFLEGKKGYWTKADDREHTKIIARLNEIQQRLAGTYKPPPPGPPKGGLTASGEKATVTLKPIDVGLIKAIIDDGTKEQKAALALHLDKLSSADILKVATAHALGKGDRVEAYSIWGVEVSPSKAYGMMQEKAQSMGSPLIADIPDPSLVTRMNETDQLKFLQTITDHLEEAHGNKFEYNEEMLGPRQVGMIAYYGQGAASQAAAAWVHEKVFTGYMFGFSARDYVTLAGKWGDGEHAKGYNTIMERWYSSSTSALSVALKQSAQDIGPNAGKPMFVMAERDGVAIQPHEGNPAMTVYAKEMYDLTQKALKEELIIEKPGVLGGIKVENFGPKWSSPEYYKAGPVRLGKDPTDVAIRTNPATGETEVRMYRGVKGNVEHFQPLESWTLRSEVASGFDSHGVFATYVPLSAVWTTTRVMKDNGWWKGYGTEWEQILLGGALNPKKIEYYAHGADIPQE